MSPENKRAPDSVRLSGNEMRALWPFVAEIIWVLWNYNWDNWDKTNGNNWDNNLDNWRKKTLILGIIGV
jgi:hypothetical protein